MHVYEYTTYHFHSVVECEEDELHCPDKIFCYPLSYICNSINNCVDGSDEQNCSSGEIITSHLNVIFQAVDLCIMYVAFLHYTSAMLNVLDQ